MLKRVGLYCLLLLSLGLQAATYTPATVPNPQTQCRDCYVSNPDAILAEQEVAYINRCAGMLKEQTQAELCVVALGSIGSAECFDFAYELYQRWGIGKRGKNTGVLVLFVLDSHDIRVMTGTGMEAILTDAQCSKIINEDMIPSFRAGRYGEGLCLGSLSIYEMCTHGDAPEELQQMRSVTNRGQFEQTEEAEGSWKAYILLFIFLAAIIWFIWDSGRGSSGGGKNTGGGYRRYYGSGYGGYGGGFSGGGFGGGSFGGGSTMGGGAGGKW